MIEAEFYHSDHRAYGSSSDRLGKKSGERGEVKKDWESGERKKRVLKKETTVANRAQTTGLFKLTMGRGKIETRSLRGRADRPLTGHF